MYIDLVINELKEATPLENREAWLDLKEIEGIIQVNSEAIIRNRLTGGLVMFDGEIVDYTIFKKKMYIRKTDKETLIMSFSNFNKPKQKEFEHGKQICNFK